MIYLDNAATSFPKPYCVSYSMSRCIRRYCGNPGRSGHRLSIKAAEKIYEAREAIASFFSYPFPERVVFTQNATYALNLAIKGLIKEKCNVIISDAEHNSVIRPLTNLQNRLSGSITRFPIDSPLDDSFENLITSDTKYIVCTAQSNVTGKAVDIYKLSKIAEDHNVKLILDLSQAAGHRFIDLSKITFAAVCCPGHKGLLGPQGTGFVIFGEKELPDSIIEGGSGSESILTNMPEHLPERIEAGTLNTPSIVGLNSGVRYLKNYGIACVEKRLAYLTELMQERLMSIKGLSLYGCENGISAFNLDGYSSEELAGRLDMRGICVRGGLHCAPSVHKLLGTLERGAVRASISLFTSKRDLDRLYTSLKAEKI